MSPFSRSFNSSRCRFGIKNTMRLTVSVKKRSLNLLTTHNTEALINDSQIPLKSHRSDHSVSSTSIRLKPFLRTLQVRRRPQRDSPLESSIRLGIHHAVSTHLVNARVKHASPSRLFPIVIRCAKKRGHTK